MIWLKSQEALHMEEKKKKKKKKKKKEDMKGRTLDLGAATPPQVKIKVCQTSSDIKQSEIFAKTCIMLAIY